MSDYRPVIIAATVGTLAVSANGAALLIALSPAPPPQAAAFGIIGLTTAFIGLIITILWACHREEPKPQKKRARVSKPKVPAAGDTEAYRLCEPRRHSALAIAAAPLTPAPQAAPAAAPVKIEAQVIVLEDWLKKHRPQQVPV